MAGVITSLPPLVEQPPGNNSSNPAGLPGVTYTAAVPVLAQTWTGLQTFTPGSMQFAGSTSGNTFLNATAIASGVLTLPAATDTLVGQNTVDTLTNKTLTNPVINGGTISGGTFTPTTFTVKDNAFTLQDDGDVTKQMQFQLSGLTTATMRTLTVPDASTTLIGKDTTDALTNKTFNTASTGNSLLINGLAATDNTGTGKVVRDTNAVLVTPALGTPSAAVLTNATGLPVSTGISGFATGVATFLATPSSANLRAALTDEVGTGAAYFVGGALGTPASGTLTNGTGLPISTGLTGAGTGVITALGVNVGTAGAPVVNGGVLGTPSSGTLTNATGLPLSGLTTQGAYTIVANATGSSAVPTAMDITALTSKASPVSGDIVLIQDSAASNAFKKTTVGALASAGSVSSIGGATGAITLGGDLAMSSTTLTNAARNYIINPSGEVNQAGVGSQTDVTYDFDQWLTLTQTAAVTVSSVADAENTTPFMMRSLQAQASAQRFGRIQWCEKLSCRDLRGQAVVLSARVRMSASTTLRYAIVEWTGTADAIAKDIVLDWTNATFTAGNFFTTTSTTIVGTGSIALTANTLTDITPLTGTVSSSMNNLAVFFWTDSTQAQNVTLDIGKAKLEKGSVASTFIPRPYDQELDLCLRYFEAWPLSLGAFAAVATGQATSTTGGQVFTFFKKTKRAAPSLSISAAGDFVLSSSVGATLTCTSLTLGAADLGSAYLLPGVASGLVAGNATGLYRNGTNAAKMFWDARL